MTIRCQGTLGAQEFYLYREGNSVTSERQKPPKPGDKAKFSIIPTTQHAAGRYRYYYYSSTGLSEHSDPLELVVTGERTLRVPLHSLPSGRGSALRVSLSQPSLRGVRRCDPIYTLPPSLLGSYSKSSLLAQLSPVVTSGGNVTLLCGSRKRFSRFILTREEHRPPLDPGFTVTVQRVVPGPVPCGACDP